MILSMRSLNPRTMDLKIHYSDGVKMLTNLICVDGDGEYTTFYVLSHACGGAIFDQWTVADEDITKLTRIGKCVNDTDRAIDRFLDEAFPYHYHVKDGAEEALR